MTTGSSGRKEGAALRGRPFFRVCHAALAAVLVFPLAAPVPIAAQSGPSAVASPTAAQTGLIALGSRGSTRIDLVECRTGGKAGTFAVAAGLAAQPVHDPARDALYAVTLGRELLRIPVSDAGSLARAALGFEPTALAVAPGADGFVLAGGHGREPLSAHDPSNLSEIRRFALPDGAQASVSDLLANTGRSRFAVAFSNLPFVWEVAWNIDAPPVLQGLVHDYRMGEAVPLPGRLTPRPFKVATPTASLLPGAEPFELGRVDTTGRFGVLNLDVRREIERPAVSAAERPALRPSMSPAASPATGAEAAPGHSPIAAWRDAGGRGWFVGRSGSPRIDIVEAGSWRVEAAIEVPGAVLAISPAEPGPLALVAHRGHDGALRIARVDARTRALVHISVAAQDVRTPLRFVGDRQCVALVDADDRWLAGFVPGDTAGAVSRPAPR